MVTVGSFGSGTSGGSRRSSNNSNKPGSGGPASMSIKNSKQKQAMGSTSNKSFLLARGWTSRLALPSILPTLRADEMEKDLRHMQVYGNAVQSYQQQFYIQTNRVGQPGENGTPTSSMPSHGGVRSPNNAAGAAPAMPLPVRIDPEEEKRLFNLRKKIAAAEVLREQLEQEWVANQAHYVHMAANLRDAQKKRKETIAFLQQAVKSRAAVTAQARLRLQMARDVSNALQYRLAKLHTAGDSAAASGMSAAAPNNQPEREAKTNISASAKPVDAMQVDETSAPSHNAMDKESGGASEDFLTELWTTAEDEYKRVCMQMMGGNEKNSKKKNSTKAVMHWPGTMLPTTPSDVPLRVSVLSTIPDKTVAYGPDPLNMIWMPTKLSDKYNTTRSSQGKSSSTAGAPILDDHENENKLLDDENPDDNALKQRVNQLEKDLALERRLNTEWSNKIASSRKVNDEWVAMMSLVRQETEALLHRHNILLESDMALTASEQLHEQEMQEKAEAEAQAAEEKDEVEEALEDEGKPASARSDSSGAKRKRPLDDEPETALAASELSSEAATDPHTTTTNGKATTTTTTTSAIAQKAQDDATAHDEAANDGDDEGSGGAEEDEKDEWAAGATTTDAATTSATLVPTAVAESTPVALDTAASTVNVDPAGEGEEKQEGQNGIGSKRPSESESQDDTEAKRRKLE